MKNVLSNLRWNIFCCIGDDRIDLKISLSSDMTWPVLTWPNKLTPTVTSGVTTFWGHTYFCGWFDIVLLKGKIVFKIRFSSEFEMRSRPSILLILLKLRSSQTRWTRESSPLIFSMKLLSRKSRVNEVKFSKLSIFKICLNSRRRVLVVRVM